MSPDQIADLLDKTLLTIFTVTAPVLFVGLAVGFFVAIFQAATQINEVTLVFIPKMLAVGVVLWQGGAWIFEQLSVLMTDVSWALKDVAAGGL